MGWFPLALILFSGPAASSELEEAVRGYWALLQKGDKAGALPHVVEAGRNAFIHRRIGPFRSWTLERIEPRSPDEAVVDEAVVTVKLDQMLPSGVYYPRPFSEIWVRQEDGWRVRVRAPDPARIQKLFSGAAASKRQAPRAGVLEVLPRQLRIHFLDRTQQGAVRIRNGLSETVRISRVDYDRTRFERLESTDSVPPGQNLRLVFRYIGNESQKPLKSEFRLLLKRGDDDESRGQLFTIPVLYNYVSSAARAVMGLTKEKLARLKRGETVKSVLPVPDSTPPLPAIPGLPPVKQDPAPTPKPTDN